MSDNGSPSESRNGYYGLFTVLVALLVVSLLAHGAARIAGLVFVVVAMVVLVAAMLRGGSRSR